MLIESLQNQTVKNLVRLAHSKERRKTGTFLAEGAHLIEEAWNAKLLVHLYLLQGSISQEEASKMPVPCDFCTQAVLNKISNQKSDASCIAVCRIPEVSIKWNSSLTLMLDGVQDPGNVGTLIRSALAFGADQVLLSKDCADLYSPKVIQSTQGALFHIPCINTDLIKAVHMLKDHDVEVCGAALHRKSICLQQLEPKDKMAVIIGSEGKGISRPLLDNCDQSIFIEMKTFESLNAAVAGSLILYQIQAAKHAL